MTTGALILAAGLSSRMGSFKPMLEIGDVTAVRRVIQTFQAACVHPVVLITGHRADELERHVSALDVVCLLNSDYATTQMLDSVKLGLGYLKGRVDRVLLTPADVPLFSVDTVRALMRVPAELACPIHCGKTGHPLLISNSLVSFIEAYQGDNGLAGALAAGGFVKTTVEVCDQGVLTDMDTPSDYRRILDMFRTAQ